MEPIGDTLWDIVISGTGLQQSMLALALSRSDKKILHVDKNDFYGGAEAAFNLKEAEAWVKKVNEEPAGHPFESAQVVSSDNKGELGLPRAYTLCLAPHVLYNKSKVLSALVSSKVFRQLEFLAVGNWWLYKPGQDATAPGDLSRIPSGREDVFADETIPMKSKRSLIKFLRNLMQPSDEDLSTHDLSQPFTEYLETNFQVPEELCDPLVSLALSSTAASKTSASVVLPRIKRHLSSIGMLGPGFAAVFPKWGGASEIAQVGCRACAVGGGVYALDRGIEAVEHPAESEACFQVKLSEGTTVRCKKIVGSPWDLPEGVYMKDDFKYSKVARSITIVSSSLQKLFPQTAEAAFVPAAAVVCVPGDPPVYLVVHSSDTAECPIGQCVIYGSTSLSGEEGHVLLKTAVENTVKSADPDANILWSLRYTALGPISNDQPPAPYQHGSSKDILIFPPLSLDLALDDGLLGQVEAVWQNLDDGDTSSQRSFMRFEDREPVDDEDEE